MESTANSAMSQNPGHKATVRTLREGEEQSRVGLTSTVPEDNQEFRTSTRDFLQNTGEMSERIRRFDWSKTQLGPIETWPQSLRTTVSLCLSSNFPINIIWGPEHIQIYNDGYRDCCGDAHPQALGEDYRVTWASAWPAIGESFDRALAGEMMYLENQRMFLKRLNGALEETFFTFSHSPIRDESGGIGGLFHPVTETTATMLAERRTRALRDLSASLSMAVDEAEVAQRTIEVLAQFDFDLPFLLFYTFEPEAGFYKLAAKHGISPGTAAAPLEISAKAVAPWPFADAQNGMRIVEVNDIAGRFGGEHCGPYEQPPNQAFVLPIIVPGTEVPPAMVVAGVSSRLPMTEAYRTFYELLSVTIAAALASVRALEDERRRAEALAELDRAKTLFFSNVSHEFRTPLTLILSPLEDALAETKGPEQRSRLELLRRNALRLQKLVNTLLDFSRIEAGRIQASYEPIDLAEFTAELASAFRSAIERAGMRLVVDCKEISEPVYVDRDMYEKIVLNLLSNAFKFTLQGEIKVMLREAEHSVEFSVTDTGSGIAEDQLAHVFERFYRIEGMPSRTHEGTGIGLALVQELIKLHGGSVAVASIVGHGSTFTVKIPKGKAHLPADRIGAARGLASTALAAGHYVEEALRWLPEEIATQTGDEAVVLGGMRRHEAAGSSRPRILWADDNADMRDYVRRLLSPLYEVEAVPDGEAALAAVRRQIPDLILADVMMPRLDGLGLLRSLRADDRARSVPVILLSARAGEESRIEGMAAGAHDYLIKPFSARELVARVDAQIKMARLRDEVAMRESDARFHALFQATPSPYLVVVPPDFTIVAVNDAYLRATMTEREAILGRPLFEVFPENPTSPSGGVQALRASLERVVAERRIDEMAVTKYDIRRPAALGGGFEERWWRPRNAPVFGPGPDGELISIIHHVEDVTTRVRVEAALRESEERYRTLFDSIDEGFCIIEMLFDERGQACDYRFLETNPAFIMQTGLTDAVGRTMLELAPQHEKFWFETYGEIARTGEARRFEHEAQALGRWYDVYAFRVGVPEEKKVAILFTDINQRRRAEAAVRESQQRQAMLAAELQHRVRNIMAIIHSIATRTAHSATSVDEYTQLLSGRLMALARTQRLLTHSKNAELSLAMLVREELNAQAHEQGEYDIQGPEVTISPKAAEVLSLAIHELATNALKYGALSEPKDRVSVRWEVTQPNGDSWLHFRWSERRAHPLSGVAPARRGFGTELIERRVPYELRGRGSLRFDAGGAQCELDFPLRHGASVLETDLPRDFPGSIRVKEVDDGGDLAGADVLILEDDFYLGTDLEQALLTRGGGPSMGLFPQKLQPWNP